MKQHHLRGLQKLPHLLGWVPPASPAASLPASPVFSPKAKDCKPEVWVAQPRQVGVIHIHGAPSAESLFTVGVTCPPRRSHPASLQAHGQKQQIP